MVLNLSEASEKLNKSELVLFLSTEPNQITKLSPRQIEARIKRISDILEKIKADRPGSSMIKRTLGTVKRKYFLEGLKRLKKESKRRDTQREALKHKLIADARKKDIIKKMNRGTEQMKNVTQEIQDQNIKVNAKQRPFQNSELKRKIGHARSRNQKVQAKRDSH